MGSFCHLTRLVEMNISHENFIFVKMRNGKGLSKEGTFKEITQGKKNLF